MFVERTKANFLKNLSSCAAGGPHQVGTTFGLGRVESFFDYPVDARSLRFGY